MKSNSVLCLYSMCIFSLTFVRQGGGLQSKAPFHHERVCDALMDAELQEGGLLMFTTAYLNPGQNLRGNVITKLCWLLI